MPEVTLSTGGVTVGGWTSVSVRKSLGDFADGFSLECPHQRTTSGVERMANELVSNEEVVIAIDGIAVLTGYIDTHDIDYDAKGASVRIAGNSRVVDLVDSSAEHASGAWKQATLQEIARDLCLPYGITVTDAGNVSGKPIQRFRLEKGEQVFDAIARAAELRGAIVTCDADGNVELVKASDTPSGVTLELGVNVFAGGCRRSTRGRHSVYKFKGQTAANGKKTTGEVVDEDVSGRYRPMVVLKQKPREDLVARATWERNVRAGKSLRYRCTVEEWTAPNGALWDVNMLCRVKDSWCGLDEDLLVDTVDFRLDNSERVTSLELVPRCAYDPQPKAFKPKTATARGFANSSNANIAFRGNLLGLGREGSK